MASPSVRFTREPAVRVAYLERRGPYSRVGAAMAELDRWVKGRGADQAGFPFCLFYDNPFETPEGELRSAACIPVRGELAPEGKFEVREFPPVDVAETRHNGPPEKFGETYGPLLEGLFRQGYSIAEPPREYFRRVEDVLGPGSGFAIRQPVRKGK